MNKIKLGPNMAIFILFFGMAMIEAFQELNLLKAVLWIAIGIVFLLADNLKTKPKNDEHSH